MSSKRTEMRTLAGLATASGYAVGPVFLYRGRGELPIAERVVSPGDVGGEIDRFKRALADVQRELECLLGELKKRTGRDDVRVFEGHLMFAEDPILMGEAESHIRDDRVNAEAAVKRAFDHARQQFEQMRDPYFRERVRDLEDVERRILTALLGAGGAAQLDLAEPSIVVADDLTPSETVQLPRELVLGFATNGGSTTSHVALLARAMGIPAVTGLGNVTDAVTLGETILLDGTNGSVTVRPDDESQQAFADLVTRQKEIDANILSGAPAGTLKDGGEILIYANVHPGVPFGGLKARGARGVGLYRSEYLWLNREMEPTEEEQFAAYRDAARFSATLGEKATITIRALDIGGDKLVRGISTTEANPFLGNRSIRYLLSHEDVFRTQLRAILRASAFGKVCLMYPMVSGVDELRKAAVILAEVKRGLDLAHIAYDREIPVGAMIEVPAAALVADALAQHVDFFSIGTNDLVQYTLAADRGNEAVAHLYQPTHPAVLSLVRHTIAAAKRRGIGVGVCGESASDPLLGVLWTAMGADMLSMSATYIPQIARLLAQLTRADLDDYAATIAALGEDRTADEIRDACATWMKRHTT